MTRGRKIIDHPDFELYWPGKTTLAWFLKTCAAVVLLVVFTLILARIGG